MSGRGRGRGRGRGGPPQSVSQQFLLRSAQEAGFDVRNLRALGRHGEIYPDIELHSSGDQDRLLVEKSKAAVKAQEEAQKQKKQQQQAAKKGGLAVKQEEEAPKPDPKPVLSPTSTAETPRSPKTIYLISKSREIHHRLQTSVFYVRSSKEVPDVIRYSDRLRPPPNIDASAVLSQCLGGRKRTRAGIFVPEELVSGQRRIRKGGPGSSASAASSAKKLNLAELAAKIRKEGGAAADAAEEEEDKPQEEGLGDGEDEYVEEDGEESDGADYVTNYYESEGDESKGSDGEPTF